MLSVSEQMGESLKLGDSCHKQSLEQLAKNIDYWRQTFELEQNSTSLFESNLV